MDIRAERPGAARPGMDGSASVLESPVRRGRMYEMDDRLASDLVWELFSRPDRQPAPGTAPDRPYGPWAIVGGLIAVGWLLFPPLAVVVACLAVAARDFRTGRQAARSIPDKAGGTVCAHFNYAWGAMKVGTAGFAMIYLSIVLFGLPKDGRGIPAASLVAMLLWMGGFVLSAIWTFSGMIAAYRSGMRIWIGEGVNRARTLLLSMLIVGFTLGVILPFCFCLVGVFPRAGASGNELHPMLLALLGCMFVGPVAIVLILDRIGLRVIADRPGKFGPKVPTVGKWNA